MIVGDLCLKQIIFEGSIMVTCNRIKVLKKDMEDNTQLYCLSNHFDIISAIYQTIQESPLLWDCHHIKGHQDDYMTPWIDGSY